MNRFNNYDLPGRPPVLSWNPVVMRCPGCGLDEHPERVAQNGEPPKHCWHLRACDMGSKNPELPQWMRDIKAGRADSIVHENEITAPLRRKKGAVIAVQFMGDVAWYEAEQLGRVLAMMHDCQHHIFLILTKWPERLAGIQFPANCFVGTSVTCQEDADKRVPALLAVNAAHLWVSNEPSLGGLDLHKLCCRYRASESEDTRIGGRCEWERIGFVACGPETGHGARPFMGEWLAAVEDQCQAAGVPFYDKRDPIHCGMLDFEPRREWPAEWKAVAK